MKETPLNVLGTALESCCTKPITGYFRDGYCRTSKDDLGTHVICAKMTKDFLAYSWEQGNNLLTPRPEFDFPGLKPDDRWCVCVLRWKEALEAGVAPPVVLESTDQRALDFVSLEDLKLHAAIA